MTKISAAAWRRVLLPLGLLAGVFLCMLLLSGTATWQRLENKGFDLLSIVTAKGQSDLPVYLVAIDDASLAAVGQRWPWPRGLHGKLIDSLSRAGAAVIAFDVVFDYPTDKREDAALTAAIQRAGNVVLAAGYVQQDTPQGTLWLRKAPLPEFVEHGAREGLVNLPYDSDLVMRKLPDQGDAFWRQIAALLRVRVPDLSFVAEIPKDGLIRYVGPPMSFPRLSYYQALEPERYLPPGELEGSLVIVGRDTHSAADISAAQADLFSTPFTLLSRELMPGSEIHANILDTVIHGSAISPAHRLLAGLWLLAACVIAIAVTWRFRPVISSLAALSLAGAHIAGAYATFRFLNLWMPLAAPLAGIVAIYSFQALRSVWLERQRKESIKRMFALYVPAEVVEELSNRPEGLQLGGEYREVTLMFTDLEGFTTLSESLPPERLTAMLNRYFTVMNEAIFRHGGTIDKFIGDAIMAFWNAPLAVPDHAARAVRAAIDMQQGMVKLEEEFVAAGLPPLRMRIGIHTGVALIGNMGSLVSRINYTAVGDAVNLAARLEGINKIYETNILVSGETAAQVDGIGFRRIDRVCAKGKATAVDIYTPTDDAELAALGEALFSAYRKERWDEAEALCADLLARKPDDLPAKLLLARITAFRADPPAPEWDGATVLKEK